MALATYSYTYGAGAQPNRQIQFFQLPDQRIQARVIQITPVGLLGPQISILEENAIQVELENTVQKANYLMRGITSQPPLFLSQLSLTQKANLFGSMEGKYMHISNGVGRELHFENVTSILIDALT